VISRFLVPSSGHACAEAMSTSKGGGLHGLLAVLAMHQRRLHAEDTVVAVRIVAGWRAADDDSIYRLA
jgi:hypothetical protein